jgi:hypothetical protein
MPRTATCRLETRKKTFEQMTKTHPVMGELYELRTALTQVRAASDQPRLRNGKPVYFLPVGPDSLSRTPLMPLGTRTSRRWFALTIPQEPRGALRHLPDCGPRTCGRRLAWHSRTQRFFVIVICFHRHSRFVPSISV